MNSHELDILTELKDASEEYHQVLIGTFSFDPIFFEEKVLPVFRSRDAENILVLTDPSEYADKFSKMKLAGQEYYIDYCTSKHTFHPKFMLLSWSEGAKLVIGSLNLTKQAWFDSAELLANLDYDFSNPNKEAQYLFNEFRKFLIKIIENNLLKSSKHKAKLQEVIDNLSWSNIPHDSKETHLIHNIERPILPQVTDIVSSNIVSAKILAPFFNKEGSVIEHLIENGCKKIDIYLQPQKVTGFPKEKILKLIEDGKNIKIFSIKLKENDERFIHAKTLILHTKEGSYCLFGSANPTYSGMLSNCQNGNLELCLLRHNKKNKYFDDLFLSESFEISEIKPQEIADEERKELGDGKSIKLRLIDAYLEKKSIFIQFEPKTKSKNAKLLLCRSEDEFQEIACKVNENEIVLQLTEDQLSFCNSRSTYVKIQLEQDTETIESDLRWISTQALELTPRRMDVKKIQDSGGRFGLISLLNKLEKFSEDADWLFYFLQRVSLERLETMEYLRRKIKRRHFESEEDIEYEKPPEINAIEKLNKKFEKKQGHIRYKADSFQFDKDSSKSFENLFTEFMALSKFIMWFVIRNQKFVAHLRFIRNILEDWVILIKKIKTENEFPFDKNIFEKLQFWQHLLVFCYLIFSYHRETRFLIKNEGVAKVFMNTYHDVVEEFLEEGKVFSLDDFSKVKEEYEEFERLQIDFEKMARFFQEELGHEILQIQDSHE